MIFEEIKALTKHHMDACGLYRRYTQSLFPEFEAAQTLADLPYLPVRAFKEFELKSIQDKDVYKIMRSSGTSGVASLIHLDRETAQLQTRTLIEIFGRAFGEGRFPMLIIDCPKTAVERTSFSARTAAINGFGMFSRGRCFALKDDLSLDLESINKFLKDNSGKNIFVFGFTFLVWKHFIQALKVQKISIDLSNSFLLHGGGWKKLEAERVSRKKFKDETAEVTGCQHVHNYYGMIEQTGSIFMECVHGNIHASHVSDVVIRNFKSLKPEPDGTIGLIQVFSTVQKSYPGQSLLTEDVGRRYDSSFCKCGHSGAVIKIEGRLEKAELRGCSDAHS